MRFRGRVLGPDGRFSDRVLTFVGRQLVENREPELGDPPVKPGLMVPGLVNAHTHLELSWLGPVPGGDGLPRWIERQMSARRADVPGEERAEKARSAARRARELGTAVVVDVCGEGSTAAILLGAGLSGVCQVELLGLSPSVAAQRAASVPGLARYDRTEQGEVWTRATAHAPYSTLPDLARVALAPGEVPATVHLGEDVEETTFLRTGQGEFAAFLGRAGISFTAAPRVANGPVGWLDLVNGLRRGVLAVHGVVLAPDELRRLAACQVGLVLCARSNLHISGKLPDVPAALAAGVALAIGTDSLASCPDLDLLAEVCTLVSAFPQVEPAVWWRALTSNGALLVGLPAFGRFTPGSSPGLLWLDAEEQEVFQAPPARTWLVEPGVSPGEGP
jgi:cytosine/adenosine deaminase-related metal-dependent hydrolase